MGWRCPPQRDMVWWGALCKALLVGMGRSKANHKAKLGPCVAETHGEPGQGGPSPQHPPASPAGVVCPLRAWRRAQGGERLLAPSRDGANAGVGRSEEQQGPAAARCCSLPRCQAACKLMMSVGGGRAHGRAAPGTPKCLTAIARAMGKRGCPMEWFGGAMGLK